MHGMDAIAIAFTALAAWGQVSHRLTIRPVAYFYQSRLTQKIQSWGACRDTADWLASTAPCTNQWTVWIRRHLDWKTDDIVTQCRQDECLKMARIPRYAILSRQRIDLDIVFRCLDHQVYIEEPSVTYDTSSIALGTPEKVYVKRFSVARAIPVRVG